MRNPSGAFQRHLIIDSCLRDNTKKHSLISLICACSKEGKVSARTIQADIQYMRDSVVGYNAPIEVYEQKYYRYKDFNFTIEKARLKKENVDTLQNTIDTLKKYSHFKDLKELTNVINILQEEIESKIYKRRSIISYEGKQNPIGLEYFDTIHDAIINKKVLCIGYHSSRSNNIISIIFYPFFLKEYKGRWYALGYKDGLNGTYILPLDRIKDFSYSILPFPKEMDFNPDKYFKDIIGVTKLSGDIRKITFLVRNKLSPYINMNPIHNSQRIIEKYSNGDYLFSIDIIPNREFFNLVIQYQPHLSIVHPKDIGLIVNERINLIAAQLPDYENTKEEENNKLTPNWDGTLFFDMI